jgi:hypothetical protein
MPKQFRKYLDFSGGMNTEADPRDIGENEVSDAYNVMFDVPGKIRNMGQLGSTPTVYGAATFLPTIAYKPSAGYGITAFGVDYIISSGTPQPMKVVAVSHSPASGNQVVGFVKDNGATVGGPTIGTTPSSKVVYYYADGALRACDANLGVSNEMVWYGYIKQTRFLGTGAGEKGVVGWYSNDFTSTFMDPPSCGIVSMGVLGMGDGGSTGTSLVDSNLQDYNIVGTENYAALRTGASLGRDITAQAGSPYTLTTDDLGGGTTWVGAYVIAPVAGTGFNVYVAASGADGTWTAQTLEFASSFIYVGGQESTLFKNAGTLDVSDTNDIYAQVFATWHTTNCFNPAITGGRVYYRASGTSDPWKLFIDINMSYGCRAHLTETYTAWIALAAITGSGGVANQSYYECVLPNIYDPDLNTYESLTGIDQNTTTLGIQARCFAVGNTRAWAANIKTVNEAGDVVYFGDRIMYTQPNKYDTWPPNNYIDIGINDGDDYRALQMYADRLLAFKNTKLYIINVASAPTEWFLESQHEGLGVVMPGATFKTDFGIVWVNRNGCFFYNGESLRNLLEKTSNEGLQRVISRSDWETFITNTAVVGFDLKRRQIVVLGDASTYTGIIYIYDMATGSWSKGDRFAKVSGYFTNFANYDNELIIGGYTA